MLINVQNYAFSFGCNEIKTLKFETVFYGSWELCDILGDDIDIEHARSFSASLIILISATAIMKNFFWFGHDRFKAILKYFETNIGSDREQIIWPE